MSRKKKSRSKSNQKNNQMRNNRDSSYKNFVYSDEDFPEDSEENDQINGVRIIPLAGVQEIGMNSTIVETPDEMLIVDAGMGFPEESMYGIDFLMANYSYAYKNKSKLKGIFLTHGHFDHIGALPYIVEKLGFPPIYGPRFAIQLVFERLKEFKLHDKVKLIEVQNDADVKVGSIKACYFHITHSIPDSCGIVFETQGKRILFTGDFKFDDQPFVTKLTSYDRIKSFGQKGVDLLLSDSTNSFEDGRAESDAVIYKQLEDILRNAPGRMVVATFSSLVNRIQIIISIAEKLNKKIFIGGRSMKTAYKIAHKWGYIKHKENTVVDSKQISNYTDSQIIFLTTGSQGEDTAGLTRISRGEHPDFKLRKGDTILLASSVIPGNAAVVQRLIDDLIMGGADVYHQAKMDVHTSGHGFREDQKMMLDMVKPKYFMPVHGYQSHLLEHGHTAVSMGVKKENVIIARNGYTFELNDKGIKKVKEVPSDPVLVDGYGIGEVGKVVLKERAQLAHNGVIAVILKVDWGTFKLKESPQILTRGFVYVKGSQLLLEELQNHAQEVFNQVRKKFKNNKEDLRNLRFSIEARLTEYVMHKINRDPIMLVVLA